MGHDNIIPVSSDFQPVHMVSSVTLNCLIAHKDDYFSVCFLSNSVLDVLNIAYFWKTQKNKYIVVN